MCSEPTNVVVAENLSNNTRTSYAVLTASSRDRHSTVVIGIYIYIYKKNPRSFYFGTRTDISFLPSTAAARSVEYESVFGFIRVPPRIHDRLKKKIKRSRSLYCLLLGRQCIASALRRRRTTTKFAIIRIDRLNARRFTRYITPVLVYAATNFENSIVYKRIENVRFVCAAPPQTLTLAFAIFAFDGET